MQELVFNGERCENDKCLADYSINREFIKQVGVQMDWSWQYSCDQRSVRGLNKQADVPEAPSMIKHSMPESRTLAFAQRKQKVCGCIGPARRDLSSPHCGFITILPASVSQNYQQAAA